MSEKGKKVKGKKMLQKKFQKKLQNRLGHLLRKRLRNVCAACFIMIFTTITFMIPHTATAIDLALADTAFESPEDFVASMFGFVISAAYSETSDRKLQIARTYFNGNLLAAFEEVYKKDEAAGEIGCLNRNPFTFTQDKYLGFLVDQAKFSENNNNEAEVGVFLGNKEKDFQKPKVYLTLKKTGNLWQVTNIAFKRDMPGHTTLIDQLKYCNSEYKY